VAIGDSPSHGKPGVAERRKVAHGLTLGIDGLRPPFGSAHQCGMWPQRIGSSDTSPVVVAADDQAPGPARRSTAGVVVDAAVADVHAVDDGVSGRATALDDPAAHAIILRRVFGAYEVTKQLPHNGREFEYRIKSASEEHERVAGESELIRP
jgi:hypothetical protein